MKRCDDLWPCGDFKRRKGKVCKVLSQVLDVMAGSVKRAEAPSNQKTSPALRHHSLVIR